MIYQFKLVKIILKSMIISPPAGIGIKSSYRHPCCLGKLKSPFSTTSKLVNILAASENSLLINSEYWKKHLYVHFNKINYIYHIYNHLYDFIKVWRCVIVDSLVKTGIQSLVYIIKIVHNEIISDRSLSLFYIA